MQSFHVWNVRNAATLAWEPTSPLSFIFNSDADKVRARQLVSQRLSECVPQPMGRQTTLPRPRLDCSPTPVLCCLALLRAAARWHTIGILYICGYVCDCALTAATHRLAWFVQMLAEDKRSVLLFKLNGRITNFVQIWRWAFHWNNFKFIQHLL